MLITFGTYRFKMKLSVSNWPHCSILEIRLYVFNLVYVLSESIIKILTSF